VRRLALGVVILFVVSILVFVATQALPGNPATAILGERQTPSLVKALQAQLGLDRPLVSQYLTWLGHTLTGNLGRSVVNQQSVSSLIGDRALNTLILVVLSAGIGVPLSLLAGAWAGARRDRAVDHAVSGFGLLANALPDFVVGLILVILFSTTAFHWLPAVSVLVPGQSPLSKPSALVLPVASLTVGTVAYLSRLVRGSVIDVYQSEYVRMARLKGAPEGVVLRRHVLPNALVPAIQGTALALAYLTGGVVVIESLFNYPGLGSGLSGAIASRDLPQIQAIVLIFAAAYVVFNLIGDALTVYATPRLRTEEA
jgi:peptide/nickel transport system permease protein